MLKRDKNGFIDIIKSEKLEPSSFKRHEKDDVDGHTAFIIQLENSPLFFMVRTGSENYHEHDLRYIEFAPNFPKSEYYPDQAWWSIKEVYKVFRIWLRSEVKTYLEEIDIPDLWEQLDGQVLFTSDPLSRRSSESFTKPEKERIRTSLENFKKLVATEYNPSEEQLEIIEDRLSYLASGLDRLNKVDWQGITVSTLISISIALSLDTEKGKYLFQLFKQAFAALLETIK